jgi:stage IV sporulation protein FB
MGRDMTLFEEPPVTRYDLHFVLAGIQVRAHPLFWLMAILFGYSSGNLIYLMIWIVCVFVSILFHELGHALMMRRFGQPSHIVLYMGGGLTVPEPTWWGIGGANIAFRPSQDVVMSLAGPGAGFLLAVLTLGAVVAAGGSIVITTLRGILPMPMAILPAGGAIVNWFVMQMIWINIFWGLINLMPVLPLDGGHIAQRILTSADPWNGRRKSLWISCVTGAIVALLGLVLLESLFMVLLFGLLSLQSYLSLRGLTGGF